MITAFDKCLKRWNLHSVLSTKKENITQDIRLLTRNGGVRYVRKERLVAKIKLVDGIRVEIKKGGVFDEVFDVAVIEFHDEWNGIENPEYTGSYAQIEGGWSRTMGGEGAVAKIIASDNTVIYSFYFPGVLNLSLMIQTILDEMRLTSDKNRAILDLNVILSIADDLELIVVDLQGTRRQKVLDIIRRIRSLLPNN